MLIVLGSFPWSTLIRKFRVAALSNMSGQAKAKTFGFSAAAHFIHRRLGSVSLLFVNDSTFSSTVRPDELHPILIKVIAV